MVVLVLSMEQGADQTYWGGVSMLHVFISFINIDFVGFDLENNSSLFKMLDMVLTLKDFQPYLSYVTNSSRKVRPKVKKISFPHPLGLGAFCPRPLNIF